VKDLPEFSDDLKVDYDYEERVWGRTQRLETSPPLEASAPLDAPAMPTLYAVLWQALSLWSRYYTYEQEPDLYDLNDQDQQTLKLYEERLVEQNRQGRRSNDWQTCWNRDGTGFGTSWKERVVIERVTPADATPVSPREAAFRHEEVAQIEIYEETPDIHKEAVLREEVRIRKEVEQDTVEAQETILSRRARCRYPRSSYCG